MSVANCPHCGSSAFSDSELGEFIKRLEYENEKEKREVERLKKKIGEWESWHGRNKDEVSKLKNEVENKTLWIFFLMIILFFSRWIYPFVGNLFEALRSYLGL